MNTDIAFVLWTNRPECQLSGEQGTGAELLGKEVAYFLLNGEQF